MKKRMTKNRKQDLATAQAVAEAMQTARPASEARRKATVRKYRATLAQLEAWHGVDAVNRSDYRTIVRYLEG